MKELNIATLSCAKYGRKIKDITAIGISINKFGLLEFSCASIEDEYATFDKVLSKLPLIKAKHNITQFQKCCVGIHNIIKKADKVVCGIGGTDKAVLRNYVMPYRYTSLSKVYFDIFSEDKPVVDIFDGVDIKLRKNSCAAIAEAFDLDFNEILDFALLITDAERTEWLPVSVVRACTYLAVECSKAGYKMSDIDASVESLLKLPDNITAINIGGVLSGI